MQIGYARISRGDHQDLSPQIATLRAAGCEIIHEEEASGGDGNRPRLAAALMSLQPGDVIAVYKLDRLGRSLRDILFILERIEQAGAGFRSVTEAIDTTTAPGRLMMQMLGAFAEFEREMIRERTLHGLANARKAGRHIGRKPKLKPAQRAEIIRMVEEGRGTLAHVAGLFDVSTATIKRVLQAHRAHAIAAE